MLYNVYSDVTLTQPLKIEEGLAALKKMVVNLSFLLEVPSGCCQQYVHPGTMGSSSGLRGVINQKKGFLLLLIQRQEHQLGTINYVITDEERKVKMVMVDKK